ncbi:hypothetical protein [Staphylococcus delphini]|uniref:hypothetical protein n=1 Tax=Staphylococcus delphini TaxID=53344 RepID=UPI000BBCF391|nr:hypothetical protein [Staphylococcus delphini]PCF40120.1 hypothetical protein B5B99_03070 [Staphylococcus delphini]PCF45491.1 hypothetical protein B5B98_07285 [Staphylococcus delphini]PCF53875.1 hypothetical protein B5C03_01020 [Staphylococcus delphini]PCF59049.1 hypothetical protein B5B97_01200 [Staphylococcus delphini]PCF60342.1 hypothetical protein B5C05_03990 [Staphylococcus delphini]
MQSAKFQLFNYIFKHVSALGVPVITMRDYHDDVPYPFVMIQSLTDEEHKSTFDSYTGSPSATLHIWGEDADRGAHDALYMQIRNILSDEIALDGYTLFNAQIMSNQSDDDTTEQTLIHTTVTVEYDAH